MAVQPGERNLKQHPWCDPHDGTKGVSFERVFLPNFYAGARGESDSRGCTVYEYITGTDEAGCSHGRPRWYAPAISTGCLR